MKARVLTERASRTTIVRLFCLGVCLGLTPACINLDWSRDSRYHPIPESVDSSLVLGTSSLEECLEHLGAPQWVLEHPIEGRDGALLAWGWYLSNDFGAKVSYAFDRFVSTSVDYQQSTAEMQGLVAIFDEDWLLVKLKRGLLRDLAIDDSRARPGSVLP